MSKVIKQNVQDLKTYIKQTEKYCPELLNLFFPITSLAADYLEVFYNKFNIEKELKFSYEEMEFSDTLKLIKEFLDDIGDGYLNKFNKALSNGNFDIFDINDLNDDRFKEPCCIEEGEKIKINIPINSTIEDGASIIHEFFHFTNSHKGKGTRDICTELISCYMELRYYQFLTKKGYDINNYYKGLYMRLNNVFIASDNTVYSGSILDIYSNTGQISKDSIIKMDKQRKIYSLNGISLLEFFNNQGFPDDLNKFHSNASYLLGGILAINLVKKPKKNDIKIKSINKYLDRLSINDVFKLLEFNINNPTKLVDYCAALEKQIKGVVYEDISDIRTNRCRKN